MRRNGYLVTSGKSSGDLVTFSSDFLCILYAECHSIPRPRFPYKVRNFDDLETFSIDISISKHTDLESISPAWTPTVIITTKFEVDMITHCQVKVFCLVISYVTLWSWPLTFWPCTAVTHAGRVTTLPPSLKTIRLCVLELSVITSFIGYHWHCVFGFCACAVSRDLSVGVNFTHIFGIHNPDLSIHYATLLALWWR